MTTVGGRALSYPDTNVSAIYNNPTFFATVVGHIEGLINRELSQSEINFTVNFIRKINYNFLVKIPKNKIVDLIAKYVIKRIIAFKCEPEIIDTHELLKTELDGSGETSKGSNSAPGAPGAPGAPASSGGGGGGGNAIQQILGAGTSYEVLKMFNPFALYKKNTLILDSRFRVLENDGTKYFKWNYVNTLATSQGSTNIVGPVRDIVSIKVWPFRIPFNDTVVTPYKKISMLIREWQSQSFVGQEGRRFHFLFDPEVENSTVKLITENNNEGKYDFAQSITQIDTITVDFGSPLESIVFNPDRTTATVYQYGTETFFETAVDHNLNTGDFVYITGYSSLNNTKTVLTTAAINKTTGFDVIVDHKNDRVFKCRIDTTELTPQIATGGTITIDGYQITNVPTTTNLRLVTGDHIRITGIEGLSSDGLDIMRVVQLYDYANGIIYVTTNYTGPATDITVSLDYRMPPLVENIGASIEFPAGSITANNGTITDTSGTSAYLEDFAVGDYFGLINPNAATPISEGPYRILTIVNDSQLLSNRPAGALKTGMTVVNYTPIDDNIMQIYFGSTRVFIPIELTYINPSP